MTIADTATEQAQDLLPMTRTIIEGPYFRIGAPERASLIEPGITGDRMMLTGQVLTPEGKPIPGAVETLETLVRFWHVRDRSVRPEHRMVAHTGFLVFARRLASRATSVEH